MKIKDFKKSLVKSSNMFSEENKNKKRQYAALDRYRHL